MADQISHSGVKGMHWGVHKAKNIGGAPGRKINEAKRTFADRQTSIKSDRAVSVSNDAATANVTKRVARNAGLDKLSNQDLQHLVTRLNLEEQYSRLTKGQNVLIEKRVERIVRSVGPIPLAKAVLSKDIKPIADAIKNERKTDFTRLDQRKSDQHIDKIAPNPNKK